MPSASSTSSALRSSRIDQPMIRRPKTSWTTARNRRPCPVWMYFKSGDPEPVRLRPGEVAVDEVGRRRPLPVADRCPRPAPLAVGTAQAELAHQPGDALLADRDPIGQSQLGVDPGRTVDLLRPAVDLADPLGQPPVGELARARRPPLPGVEAL